MGDLSLGALAVLRKIEEAAKIIPGARVDWRVNAKGELVIAAIIPPGHGPTETPVWKRARAR